MAYESTAWKGQRIRAGNFDLDPETLTVRFDEEHVRLTPLEYHLLALLAWHAGKVLPNSFITGQLWQSCGTRENRRLGVLVSRLRALIKGLEPYTLETVRSRGYGLVLADGRVPMGSLPVATQRAG